MEPPPLQNFYADIEAARVASVPVELTSRSLLQSVAMLSGSKVRELAAATQQHGSSVDDRHQAALGVHQQLGSMVPVLDGLSARAIACREFSVIVRRVLWYLLLVLLAALVGLYFFEIKIVPEYYSIREDMRVHAGMTEFNLDVFPYLLTLKIAILVLFVVALVLLLLGKTNFLMGWFGGRKYVRLKVSSAAARTLGLLASQEVPLADATQDTATLYSLDNVGRRAFSESFGGASDTETYQILSQYWSLQAAKTFERARAVVPVAVLTVVGGGVAAAYGVLVYGPLVGLLRDMVETGITI